MKKNLSLLIIILFSITSFAQVGLGTASVSYSRQVSLDNQNNNGYYNSNSNNYPNVETLKIEDFINYHKHQIKIPSDQKVAVSIDYNNAIFNDPNYALVQVGIATPLVSSNAKVRGGVNISLVVDNSGSMYGQKMELVKKALNHLVDNLISDDIISITTFSTDAQVVLSSQKVGNQKEKIRKVIDDIRIMGSTNLNAGMMLGYKEAFKNNAKNTTSRVILLTDGETNVGETNHDRIVDNSTKYNQEGIEISTIGIGQSLDFQLLRTLADKGKGSNYYIGENEEDIYKVFDEELDAILYRVGTNQKVDIELPSQWTIVTCYGYDAKATIVANNKIHFDLENLGANSTRIILLKVRKSNNSRSSKEIVANLSYLKDGRQMSVNEVRLFDNNTDSTSPELTKNYDIAYMASTLKLASIESRSNITNANQSMNTMIYEMSSSDNFRDSDFQRVYKIVEQYKTGQPTPTTFPRIL